MLQKKSNLTMIMFAALFGMAVSVDISGLINSKLLNYINPTDIETAVNKNSSVQADVIEDSSIHPNYRKSESNTNFSGSNQEEVTKPFYPKPTIKLLVFKKHSDKQFYKRPASLTYA